MLNAVNLSESTLMFRGNSTEVTIPLIKHIPFINSGGNGKDTNGTVMFDIKFPLPFMNGSKDGGISELVKLCCIK